MGSSGSLTGDLVPSESHAHANKVAERSARQHPHASGGEVSTIRGTIHSKSLTSTRLQSIQKPLLLAGQGGSALTKASDARRITYVSPATYTSGELETKMKLLIMSKDELVNAAAEFTAGDTIKQTAVITILEGEQADRSAAN